MLCSVQLLIEGGGEDFFIDVNVNLDAEGEIKGWRKGEICGWVGWFSKKRKNGWMDGWMDRLSGLGIKGKDKEGKDREG